MNMTVISIIVLVALCVGAFGYAAMYERIQNSKKSEARVNRIKAAETSLKEQKAQRNRAVEMTKRRKNIQDSLKSIDEKKKENNSKKAVPLKLRLMQAGLKITEKQFYLISLVLGVVFGLFAFASLGQPFIALGLAFVGGLGLPRWFIAFLSKRRLKAFLKEFPNALDVMVRSIKSGLPLNDAIRLIASDGQEPVKSEFSRILQGQKLGIPTPEACARMYDSIPLPETNFFATVITIQAQAGGNLSEALGNLSRVLRERQKMKGKVQAMSMEAKASAAIIGALPFIVAFLVFLTSPDYIIILFTDPRGHLILGFSAVWMTIGILVMRNMINFEI